MRLSNHRSIRSLLLTTLCSSALLPTVRAHVQMMQPMPWDSPKSSNADLRDYDITSPLEASGSNFPCQGMTSKLGSLSPTVKYVAGKSYTVTLSGTANHSGGSCQLSLSYDSGKTWKVIKSIIGGCPESGITNYDFTMPAAAPSGTAIFAWTWINHTGNREFYMDCAVVTIQNSGSGNLCSLPNLFVANLNRINSCVVPEGTDAVFPNPGSDVEYDGAETASSPAFRGSCEIPDTTCGDSSGSSLASSQEQDSSKPSINSGVAMAENAAAVAGLSSSLASLPSASADISSYINSVLAQSSSPSSFSSPHYITTTISSTTTTTTTLSVTSTYGSLAIASFIQPILSANSSSYNANFTESSISISTHSSTPINVCTTCVGGGMGGMSTMSTIVSSSSSSRPNSTPTTPTLTATPINGNLTSDTTMAAATTTDSARPPYVTADPNAADSPYVPCTPGALLCSSKTQFYMCNQMASISTANDKAWSLSISVAPGMMCLPFLLPNGSRNDRYVRDRPFGDCNVDGAISCMAQGDLVVGFAMCDQGGWIDMGNLAAGTTCVNGEIIAAQ